MAYGHLGEIYDYVAEQNSPAVAQGFTDAIVDYCQDLLPFPVRGKARDDLLEGLRVIGFRRRVQIAFLVTDEVVEIHGIYYGGQNWERRFENERHSTGQPPSGGQ